MSVSELIEKEKELLAKEYELKLEHIKQEYEEDGWGDLEWLSEKTTIKSRDKLQEMILHPYRTELEGHIVSYGGRGRAYVINKKPMLEWLENNFERVWE